MGQANFSNDNIALNIGGNPMEDSIRVVDFFW